MKKVEFLILIIFLLSLTFWIYFNTIGEKVELLSVGALCFHFITFQYLAILLVGFYCEKEICMANFLGMLLILAFFGLIFTFLFLAFESKDILRALFAPIYLTLVFSPLYFFFLPVHLLIIYIQYSESIVTLSRYHCCIFYVLLGLLLAASIGYYVSFESIIGPSMPGVI